jgi:hypothetical protein
MSEPLTPHEDRDHTRAVIIASTIVALTCILSCAVVVIILILRIP